MNEHELGYVTAFVLASKRDRWLEKLGSKNGRTKVLARLAHNPDHDPAVSVHIESTDDIVSLLNARGAPPNAYVMSEWSELDGKVMPLREAVEACLGQGMGTVVSCLPGRLAYFEGEGPEDRYLLVAGKK